MLYLLFLLVLGGLGVAMILYPGLFVVGPNPPLVLLREHLPEKIAFGLIRGFGLLVVFSALFFVYVLYLT